VVEGNIKSIIMAVPGRKPKPTALRLVEGNREHRPIGVEPKPQPIMPECPEIVDGYAREVWDKLSAILLPLGLLTEADGLAFAALCIEWERYVEMVKALRESGAVWKSDSGYKQAVPEFTIASKSLGRVQALLAEFGATPSARARLSIKADKDDDEFGDLI
jgi:P27 family predicted phage terminase small subunit